MKRLPPSSPKLATALSMASVNFISRSSPECAQRRVGVRAQLGIKIGETQAKGVRVSFFLGVDSPFFSTIVLFKNRICFPRVLDGFLKRRIPGKNREGTPRLFSSQLLTCPQSLEINGDHFGTFTKHAPKWETQKAKDSFLASETCKRLPSTGTHTHMLILEVLTEYEGCPTEIQIPSILFIYRGNQPGGSFILDSHCGKPSL